LNNQIKSLDEKQFRALVQHIVSKESSKTINYINFINHTYLQNLKFSKRLDIDDIFSLNFLL
ncbi:MAG: hypothetical protein ACK4SO_02625, partial [Candidatus Kapaibacteriota bacterium]